MMAELTSEDGQICCGIPRKPDRICETIGGSL
jgi:hypothetical protein